MPTDGPVWALNEADPFDAADLRALDSVLLAPHGTSPLGARPGRRVNGAGLAVSLSSGPESWTVSEGSGVIFDSARPTLGAWRFALLAPKGPVELPPRPGTGTSRIDCIVAQISDSDSEVGSTKELVIRHVAGQAGSSPSAPDLDPLTLVLATLTVPATGSITVAPGTSRATAAGGVEPVATTAARDAIPNPYNGLMVYNLQSGRFEGRAGGEWRALADEQSGAITMPPQWTQQSTRPLRWFRQGGLVFLAGSANYSSDLGTTGQATLNGIPPVSIEWSGSLRNGNALLTGFLSTAGVINWSSKVGSGSFPALSLDGVYYRTA